MLRSNVKKDSSSGLKELLILKEKGGEKEREKGEYKDRRKREVKDYIIIRQ